MDTSKWKSVYTEIKKLSKIEGRTISGQLRHMFDQYARLKSTQTKLKMCS